MPIERSQAAAGDFSNGGRLIGNHNSELERLYPTLLILHRNSGGADRQGDDSRVKLGAAVIPAGAELCDRGISDLSGIAIDGEVAGINVQSLSDKQLDLGTLEVIRFHRDRRDHITTNRLLRSIAPARSERGRECEHGNEGDPLVLRHIDILAALRALWRVTVFYEVGRFTPSSHRSWGAPRIRCGLRPSQSVWKPVRRPRPRKELGVDQFELTILLVPVFVLAILVIRGLPGFFTPDRGTSFSDRRTAALFIATTLPLVIAVTQIGVDTDVLDESTAAAMVGAALVTVLLFPLLALVGRQVPGQAELADAKNAHTDQDTVVENAHE